MPTTWKLAKSKTWRQKLAEVHPNHGKLVPTPDRWRAKYGAGKMLIPDPREMDKLVRTVRKGKLLTQSQLRDKLAQQAGATATCPMTTGIFLRVVAEAAEEAARDGKQRTTPYWRVVRDDGGLIDKFPGGVKAQAAHLRDEGHEIEPAKKSKPPRVRGFTAAAAG